MLTISTSTTSLFSQFVDCYAFILEKNYDSNQLSQSIKNIIPDFESILQKQKFTGNTLETVTIPFVKDGHTAFCIFVGIGDLNAKRGISLIERYRRALGQMVKQVRFCKGTTVALTLPFEKLLSHNGFTEEYLAQQTAITLKIADYHFDDYITAQDRKENKISQVIFITDENNKKKIEQGIAQGEVIGNAVNQARHWVDTPPSDLTPQHLVEKAQEIATRNNLTFTAFHEKEIIHMGMGGLAAVSRGSVIDCALIILEYKSLKKDALTLCFVGKGITFDSGGLSLKPAESMETMKEDMSGAAAVICAIDALAQLKPDVNIIVLAPTSENLPSGHATKPGDIVTFYNGKTAEIKNTDAEGRLILADALSYAVKQYKPTAMIDIATLTGACARALGPFYSGLFSENDDLLDRLIYAGSISGDELWHLPMSDDYKKAISSKVADICNIGSKQIPAGATTAAHFLQHFVGDVPWAHIDIAGTAFDVPNISYYGSGATGVGVRLLVELAMSWK